MNGKQYLNLLKTEPVDPALFFDMSAADIIDIVTAWAMSSPMINESVLGSELPCDDEDRFSSIWSGVTFNLKSFQMNCKRIVNEKTLRRLVEAKIIYPDGTYNQSAIQQLIQQEVVRDA